MPKEIQEYLMVLKVYGIKQKIAGNLMLSIDKNETIPVL